MLKENMFRNVINFLFVMFIISIVTKNDVIYIIEIAYLFSVYFLSKIKKLHIMYVLNFVVLAIFRNIVLFLTFLNKDYKWLFNVKTSYYNFCFVTWETWFILNNNYSSVTLDNKAVLLWKEYILTEINDVNEIDDEDIFAVSFEKFFEENYDYDNIKLNFQFKENE